MALFLEKLDFFFIFGPPPPLLEISNFCFFFFGPFPDQLWRTENNKNQAGAELSLPMLLS